MSDDTAEAPTSTRDEMAAALSEQMGEDKSQSTQATEQDADTAQQTEAPDYFEDNFDPQTLHESARPAYEQMRKAFTQKTQDLAEQRKQTQWQQDLITDLQSEDPEAKSNALQWMAQNGLLTEEQTAQVFGWEFEQGQDDEEQPDDVTQLKTEWEQFKAERKADAEKAAQEDFVARVDADAGEQLSKIAKTLGRELPQRTQELLVSRALVAHVKPDGMLDINSAFAELQQEWNESQRGWASSKETTSIQPGGEAATEVPDLDTSQARVDKMAAEIEALERSRSV